MTAEGKGAMPAKRTAPGRGGRPQGRRTFAPSKVQLRYFRESSKGTTFAKVAKAPMFVYSAARKGKRMERLSLKQRERYGSIHVSFRWRG